MRITLAPRLQVWRWYTQPKGNCRWIPWVSVGHSEIPWLQNQMMDTYYIIFDYFRINLVLF